MDLQLHFPSQQQYKLTFPGSYHESLKKAIGLQRLTDLVSYTVIWKIKYI